MGALTQCRRRTSRIVVDSQAFPGIRDHPLPGVCFGFGVNPCGREESDFKLARIA